MPHHYKDEEKVDQSLMMNPLNFPEEKFTSDGRSYYYTRPDGTPITNDNWSLKDIAYPLNLLFGGKKPTDESWGLEEGSSEYENARLSGFAFTNWLVNTAPSQIGAFGKGVQAAKGKYFYKPPVKPPINVTPKRGEQIVNEVFSLKRTKPPTALIPKYAQNAKIYLGDQPPASTFMTTYNATDPVPEWVFSWKGTQFDKNRSDRLGLNAPTFDSPREKRYWFSKATYERTLDEVLAQGGTELQANQIYRKISDNLKPKSKGGRGIVAAITELNNLAEAWEPGIVIKPTEVVINGVTKWRYQFKDKDGTHRTWLFDKDHIQPVIDANRVGGGYVGADNPKNLEILLQQINVRKGNVFQLDQRILKEMGIPETFSEYINMELYPQNYEGMHVPQYWQENFQKIVLADYYEATKGVKSEAKRSAIMGSIVAKHAAFFKDPVMDAALRKLDDALGQQVAKNIEEGVAAGNEVPAWIGLLQKPPGGWNGNDPWWNDLSPEAKTNYRQMYDYKQRTIPMKQPYKRPPQGGKDYES